MAWLATLAKAGELGLNPPVPTASPQRRLTAIVSADVVGFSRLMAQDEVATLAALADRVGVIEESVRGHGGRVVDSVGDNVLAEFPSVVAAVCCTLAFQREIQERNTQLPIGRRLEFRTGVHIGDVVVDRDRIYGDGVNIAARLEALADAGGICVSAPVYEQVLGKVHERFEGMGVRTLKNIPRPVEVYRVLIDRGNDADETIRHTASGERTPEDGETRLRVEVAGRVWVVSTESPEVSFGRGSENDIVLEDPYVSRRHGFFVYREGDVVLVDRSSNGSVVRQASGNTRLHKDTLSLAGSGSILLGDSKGARLDFAVEVYRSETSKWTETGESAASNEGRPDEPSYLFRLEGEFWTLSYAGHLLRLKDSKGLRLIAYLLSNPGVEVHALDLASIVSEGDAVPETSRGRVGLLEGGHVSLEDGAGPLLDRAARTDYKRRLAELREELAEAESFNDSGRVERARAEIEFLGRQLAEAVGLGGRDRPSASNAERARVMVTHRIRDALKKIRRDHPDMAAHLDAHLRTGTFCSYSPDAENPIDWSL